MLFVPFHRFSGIMLQFIFIKDFGTFIRAAGPPFIFKGVITVRISAD